MAPVVDFGGHLGAQGIHGWAFWIAFGGPRAILDVSFSVFSLKLFFNHNFGCFFYDLRDDLRDGFSCWFIAGRVHIPHMILYWFGFV